VVIRAEQMRVFTQAAERRFADQMVEHLRKLFPRVSGKLGEPGLREVVQSGISRAGEYGILRQRDVGRYIAIMLMCGPNFDSKPGSGPLYAALRDPRFTGSRARTEALCQAALRGLKNRTVRTGRRPNW